MTILRIEGMHCGACVRRVALALEKVPGTHVGEVQIGTAVLDTTASDDQILGALAKAGFAAQIQS